MPTAILPRLASRLPAGRARRWLQRLSAGAPGVPAARRVRSPAAAVPHRRPPMLQLKAPAGQRSDVALRDPPYVAAYTALVRHARWPPGGLTGPNISGSLHLVATSPAA